MPAEFRFSLFRSVQDNQPATRSGFSEFEGLISAQPLITNDKGSVPLISPAVYLPGSTRGIQNVEACSFFVLDIDKSTESDVIEKITSPIFQLGWRCYVHSTHSYGDGKSRGLCKVRIIIPSAREVSPEEYVRCMDVIDDLTGRLADRQALHPAAIFYVWSTPPGYKDVAWSQSLPGELLNPDHLLSVSPRKPSEDFAVPAVSQAELSRISTDLRFQYAKVFFDQFAPAVEGEQGDARTYQAACVLGDFGLTVEQGFPLLEAWNQACAPPWSRKELWAKAKNAYKYRTLPLGWRLADHGADDIVHEADLLRLAKERAKKEGKIGEAGRALRAALSGDPIAPIRIARTTLEDAAWLMATSFPNARPHALCEHVEKCINATHASGARDITMVWLRQEVEMQQQRIRQSRASKEFEQHDEVRRTLKDCFASVGQERATPYTRKELETFAEALDCDSPAELRRRWIIRKGDSLWFLVAGQYVGPYQKSEALGAAQVLLAPAGIELDKMSRDGTVRQKTLPELFARYGSVASRVVADLALDAGRFAWRTQTLYEAPCPKRKIEPEYSEFVDGWIRTLTGDGELYEKLLDWIAVCPQVEEPTCGLLFWGERGTGKSLFAHAVSRLWGTSGPTELDDIAGNFNDKLTNNPVVFGDETVPEDWRGEPRTDLIRKFVQERQRTLRRKFVPDADLLGSMRLIIAANSPDILVSNRKALTNYDIEAINERFLVVHIPGKAPRTYLEKHRREDPAQVRALTHGDALVKHMMHLGEHRAVSPGSRLLVEGIPGSELEMRMMTGAGLRSEICHWVVGYLLNPGLVEKVKGEPMVLFNAEEKETEFLVTSKILHGSWSSYCDERPNIGAIQRALGGVSERVTRNLKKVRKVDLDRVYYWAETNGASNREDLQKCLAAVRDKLHAVS